MPARSRTTTTEAQIPSRGVVAMPPHVAALVMLANDGHGIPEEFRTAWAQMPAMIDQLANGDGDAREGTTRHGCIREQFQAAVTKSREEPEVWDRRLARAVDALEAIHTDTITDVEVALGDPAFYTGLAMGLYLMANPAPIVLREDGGR